MATLYDLNIMLGNAIFSTRIFFHENTEIPGKLILSATMFRKMIYTFNTIDNIFTLDTNSNQIMYNLKLRDNEGNEMVYANTDGNKDSICISGLSNLNLLSKRKET